MGLELARIDDRLIHGQVTVGWGRQVHPDLILLANDSIAADPWQSRVYASSVPPEIQVSIESLPNAAVTLTAPETLARRILLLTGTAADMHGLMELGVELESVNVGGLHHGAGKFEMLPFVFLDRSDWQALGELLRAGIDLVAQQVPGGRAFDLDAARLRSMEEYF